MAHLGRRLRDSSQRRSGRRPMTGSVIDLSQLPSPSPSGSYHLEPFLAEPSDQRSMTDSTLPIRIETRRDNVKKFHYDTVPLADPCGAVGPAPEVGAGAFPVVAPGVAASSLRKNG